ncbi:MAG: TatD family hydrolase, partial [bacterium]
FPKANQVREAAKQIPLDKIMIETDCPFLAPQTFRGQRNEPSYVVEVAKKLAEVKDISLDEVAKQTTSNVKEFFAI